MHVAEFEDHESANQRIQSEWTRANAARDSARVAAALAASQVRRVNGPVRTPTQPTGTAAGRAGAARAADSISAEEAAYVARVADERRIAEARRTNTPSRYAPPAQPSFGNRSADRIAQAVARGFGNGA